MLKVFRKYLYNNFRKHSETDNLLLNKKQEKGKKNTLRMKETHKHAHQQR